MSKYLELWLLKCMVKLYLHFSETDKLSSKVAVYFILTPKMKVSCFCTILLSVIGITVSWILITEMCFPRGSAGKEYACNMGDLGSIPGLGRSPGEGKGYLLQYSGLENSTECMVHGVAKSWRQPRGFHFNHWNRYTGLCHCCFNLQLSQIVSYIFLFRFPSFFPFIYISWRLITVL